MEGRVDIAIADQTVVARAAEQQVIAPLAIDRIIARAAIGDIVAVERARQPCDIGVDGIVAFATEEHIRPTLAGELIGARTAIENVITVDSDVMRIGSRRGTDRLEGHRRIAVQFAGDAIRAVAAEQHVRARAAHEQIVARIAVEQVIGASAIQAIVAAPAVEDVCRLGELIAEVLRENCTAGGDETRRVELGEIALHRIGTIIPAQLVAVQYRNLVGVAIDQVVARPTDERVLAPATGHDVGGRRGNRDIVARATGQPETPADRRLGARDE